MLFTRLTIIGFLAAAWFWTSEAAELYAVVCVGTNNEMRCPDGLVIDEVRMGYGVNTGIECKDRKKSAKLSTRDCIIQFFKFETNEICNRRNYCKTPKTSVRMFNCEASADNFIQRTYTCKEKNPAEITVIACEGETAQLKCETGTIRVVKANFGRMDKDICTDVPSEMTYCTSFASLELIQEVCDGKTECSQHAVPKILGSPVFCDENPEYLRVDYVCE